MLSPCPPANLIMLSKCLCQWAVGATRGQTSRLPFCLFLFFKTASLCNTGWHGTHYIDQTSLLLTATPLPSKCAMNILFFKQNVGQWVKTRVLDGFRDCFQYLPRQDVKVGSVGAGKGHLWCQNTRRCAVMSTDVLVRQCTFFGHLSHCCRPLLLSLCYIYSFLPSYLSLLCLVKPAGTH